MDKSIIKLMMKMFLGAVHELCDILNFDVHTFDPFMNNSPQIKIIILVQYSMVKYIIL
jgi:hypothetical protein